MTKQNGDIDQKEANNRARMDLINQLRSLGAHVPLAARAADRIALLERVLVEIETAEFHTSLEHVKRLATAAIEATDAQAALALFLELDSSRPEAIATRA